MPKRHISWTGHWFCDIMLSLVFRGLGVNMAAENSDTFFDVLYSFMPFMLYIVIFSCPEVLAQHF